MTRTPTYTLLILSLVLSVLAQQGRPPYTTNNAQSACVEFGSCSTAGGASVITATQNAPVTAPAGTPALATFTTLDSSFISSLAAAGASSAYQAQGGSGGGGNGGNGGALTITSTVSRGRATSTGGSGNGGSGGSSSMGLGSLGNSSNGGKSVVGMGGMAVQLMVVALGAVLGAAMLL